MKRIVAFGLVAVVLCSVSGCGSPDSLFRELLANLNLCAEMIEKGEPKDRVQLALDRANTTAEKINKLQLSKEKQEEYLKRYDDEFKKVAERLVAAQAKRKLELGDDLPPIVLDGFIKK